MMKLVVLSCFLAAAAASAVPVLSYALPLYQPYNYRGPLSLAPGQPANILGADGRPLDTLEVNADRAAHLTAKAFDGGYAGYHLLKKRSAAFIAPIAPVAAYTATYPLAYSAPLLQPYNYRGPLSLAPGQPANILGADGRPLDTLEVNADRAAHFAAKTGLHILKKRSAAFVAPVSNIAIARTPLITPAYSYASYAPYASYASYAPYASYASYASPIIASPYSRFAYTGLPIAGIYKK